MVRKEKRQKKKEKMYLYLYCQILNAIKMLSGFRVLSGALGWFTAGLVCAFRANRVRYTKQGYVGRPRKRD